MLIWSVDVEKWLEFTPIHSRFIVVGHTVYEQLGRRIRVRSIERSWGEQLHHKAARPFVGGSGQPLGDPPQLGFFILVGALAMVAIGRYLGRRQPGAGARTPQGWPVNFAHRGGAKIAPENTLEGFREGLRVGAGVLELDVHATADGTVVVHHDEKVDRTAS